MRELQESGDLDFDMNTPDQLPRRYLPKHRRLITYRAGYAAQHLKLQTRDLYALIFRSP